MKTTKILKQLEHRISELGRSGALESGRAEVIGRELRKLRMALQRQDLRAIREIVARISGVLLAK